MNDGTAMGAPPGAPSGALSGPPSGAGVVLTCQPRRDGAALVFAYKLENHGAADILAMDAMPEYDPATETMRANADAAVVFHHPGGDAVIGKFVPPLPPGARAAHAAIPLAFRIRPGASLERTLHVPLPLAETSPYFADLTLRGYEQIALAGVLFTIGFWTADTPGLAVMPADYAPELLVVAGGPAAAKARRATRHFPVTKLDLFRRTDAFPRPAF
jgi:hypothetical protein